MNTQTNNRIVSGGGARSVTVRRCDSMDATSMPCIGGVMVKKKVVIIAHLPLPSGDDRIAPLRQQSRPSHPTIRYMTSTDR